jgi:F-type H+-transporting ATPase subunit b
VYPSIVAVLDTRARSIAESIDAAEKTRQDADQMLAEYQERLKDARGQADEIIARARKAADVHEHDAQEQARVNRERMLEQTRRDIEAETRRAIQEIRREVADLTVMATEKLTRKVLTEEDQRRLIDEAMAELDFSALSGAEGSF